MDRFTALPTMVLVIGWLAIALLAAIAGRAVVRALVPEGERGLIQQVCAPLMPALGATFAVLMAITLSSEAGYLKSAQDLVSTEGAAASRLAWAATSAGVDPESIQTPLLDYLTVTRQNEWEGDAAASGDDADTEQAIAALQRAVRTQAGITEIGTPASGELLSSVDAVTGARRTRVAAAARQLPALYVVTLVASGIALILNAGALAAQVSRRVSQLIAGLAIVVGLSLALLFALSAPWRGPLVVSGHAIDAVAIDLQNGFFSP